MRAPTWWKNDERNRAHSDISPAHLNHRVYVQMPLQRSLFRFHANSRVFPKRAEAYKNYFLNFTVDSKRLEPAVIFAAKDSKKSHRPRLTVEPFAKAAKLKIDTRFGNSQSTQLAADLRANHQGKVILICWRHPYVPDLLRALGAKPEDLLPRGKWPGAVYDWVILLSFDQDGRLIPGSSRRINEHLMPDDFQ